MCIGLCSNFLRRSRLVIAIRRTQNLRLRLILVNSPRSGTIGSSTLTTARRRTNCYFWTPSWDAPRICEVDQSSISPTARRRLAQRRVGATPQGSPVPSAPRWRAQVPPNSTRKRRRCEPRAQRPATACGARTAAATKLGLCRVWPKERRPVVVEAQRGELAGRGGGPRAGRDI